MKRFAYFISPSILEVVIYMIIAGALLVGGSYKQILSSLPQVENDDQAISMAVSAPTPSDIQNLAANHDWLAVASTIFFWTLVGTVLLIVVWAGVNMLIELYNTYIVATGFMHPRAFEQKSLWKDYFERMIARLGGGVGLVAYAFLLVGLLYPGSRKLFGQLIDDPRPPMHWLLGLSGVLLLAASLHILVVGFRVLALRPRIFESR